MTNRLLLTRSARKSVGNRYSMAPALSGAGVPGAGLGSDGDIYTRTDQPYTGWQYRKASGAWSLFTVPDAHLFEQGVASTTYRNPIAYSNIGLGEVATGINPPGSLHFGRPIPATIDDDYSLTALPVGGALHSDSSIAYGAITDPSGNGQSGWMEMSCRYDDQANHGTNLRRSEESYSELADAGDEWWHAFSWRDFSNAQDGFGKFEYRTGSDYDSADVQFIHDIKGGGNYSGGMPSFLALVYTTRNVPGNTPVRFFRLSPYAWNGSSYACAPSEHRNLWAGGTSVTLANGRSATVDPNWPANAGERWKFIVHVKYGYTGSFCKIWGAPFGTAPSIIVDDTGPLGFDPLQEAGGTLANSYVGKGRGIYLTSYPDVAGLWKFRAAKRRDRGLRNCHQLMLNAGHTESSIVAGFNSFLEGA